MNERETEVEVGFSHPQRDSAAALRYAGRCHNHVAEWRLMLAAR